MADYTKTKSFGKATYPVHANGTSGLLKRAEPILTPAMLKSRHLKGILELAKRLGITWTDEELKDQINLAINQAELELGCNVFPEQFVEKHPFDVALYKAFMYTRTEQGPITSIEDFSIVSASGQNIFVIPIEWIETAQFHQRQINVIPLLSTFGTANNDMNTPVASGGIAYLSILLNQMGYVPSYWQVTYTAGMTNTAGEIPVVVNKLIGIMTAMEILSLVAANNTNNSVSISQDGIGQSVSTPGPQLYAKRMEELEEQKMTVLRQIKKVMGGKYFLGTL